MLSICDLETLHDAYSVYSELTLDEGLRRIGNPSAEMLIAFAVEQVSRPERNLRVLALRVLAHQRGERAMHGVLAGLNDEKRRVCAVAIQACPSFLVFEEIVRRLEAIVHDTRLKRKLRRHALSMLSGNEGRWRGDLTAEVVAAPERLMAEPSYRF